MSWKERIIFLFKIVVALAVVWSAWQYGVKPRMVRFQEWEGTLTEAYRKFDPNLVDLNHPNKDREYRYYWRVTSADGESHDIEVPLEPMWIMSKKGTNIIKRSGAIWPLPEFDLTDDEIAFIKAKAQEDAKTRDLSRPFLWNYDPNAPLPPAAPPGGMPGMPGMPPGMGGMPPGMGGMSPGAPAGMPQGMGGSGVPSEAPIVPPQ